MKQTKSIKTAYEEGSMIEVIIAVLVGLLILLAVALMLWSIYVFYMTGNFVYVLAWFVPISLYVVFVTFSAFAGKIKERRDL